MPNAKHKFICEKELLSNIADETNFLENKVISQNAQKIIELCRKNKKTELSLMHF